MAGSFVSSPSPSNRACGFPAHGSPTFFTVGVAVAFQGRNGLGATTVPHKVISPRLFAQVTFLIPRVGWVCGAYPQTPRTVPGHID